MQYTAQSKNETNEKNNMKLLLLLSLTLIPGCAYKGDVYLYSPSGEGNAVEKAFDTDIDVPLVR